MENKPLYVAVDSDALRHLAYLHMLKKKYKYIERHQINDPLLAKDLNYYIRIYQSLNNDELRLKILEPVFHESKHSQNLLEFMKECCYFPDVNSEKYTAKRKAADELAYAYCESHIYEGEHYDSPMKKVYMAAVGQEVPTNDSFIMAWSTMERCCLLTGNKKDFIFNEKQDSWNKDRLQGICRVNHLMGYYAEENGNVYTPKPITVPILAGALKNKDNFKLFDQSENEEMVEGRTIL